MFFLSTSSECLYSDEGGTIPYLASTFRIASKMHTTQKKDSKLYAWHKDEHGQPDVHLLDILKIVLSEDELNQILNVPIGAPSRILDLLKSKMLSEMNELVFGSRMLSMSIEEQQKIATLSPINQEPPSRSA